MVTINIPLRADLNADLAVVAAQHVLDDMGVSGDLVPIPADDTTLPAGYDGYNLYAFTVA